MRYFFIRQLYIVLSLLILCFFPLNVSATLQSAETYKLLIIDSQKGEPYKTARESALAELKRRGYEEGENLVVKVYSLGNYEGTGNNIWKIEKQNQYDAILVNGTIATMSFKKLVFNNPKVPVVFVAITDPVGVGVIDSFDTPPKSNFTGVCYPVPVAERLGFIRQVMPKVKKIGLVYADMPQSHSYLEWLQDALASEEFKDIELITRKVPFIKSEGGHKRMAMLAKSHIKELDPLVDVFMSPNDQMGVQRPFVEVVYETATKPLVGLGRKDVMEKWGATISIYPSMVSAGTKVGHKIVQLFQGVPIQDIYPEYPDSSVAFDLNKAEKFGIVIPETLLQKTTDIIH